MCVWIKLLLLLYVRRYVPLARVCSDHLHTTLQFMHMIWKNTILGIEWEPAAWKATVFPTWLSLPFRPCPFYWKTLLIPCERFIQKHTKAVILQWKNIVTLKGNQLNTPTGVSTNSRKYCTLKNKTVVQSSRLPAIEFANFKLCYFFQQLCCREEPTGTDLHWLEACAICRYIKVRA